MIGAFTTTTQISIFVGMRKHYTDIIHTDDEVKDICQKYCDTNGLCVTLTKTEFIYTNGNEPGYIVGLINYPRFPTTDIELVKHAATLALELKSKLEQLRVSIVTPQITFLIGDDNE